MRILKKIKFKWILIATIVMLIALPLTANAQATVTSQMSGVLGDVLQSFANFLSIMLKLLQRILWPIFLAIGGLLNNDILFGYGMEQRLLEVWVQIRNFVNIIFVVALLGVAIFNVLAFKPDSEFALKTFLPKFAIALVAVNFSYVAMKIVLDVSNVMTYAVFALPSSIGDQVATPRFMSTDGKVKDDAESKKIVDKICKAYYGEEADWTSLQKEIDDIRAKNEAEASNIKQNLLCDFKGTSGYVLSDAGNKFFQKFNSRNVALIMAIQFMNVTKVDEVNFKTVKGSSDASGNPNVDISTLTFQLLFAVVLYIVYGAAYLAIFVVLLVRLVVLWLFIALSPVIVLKFVLPQGVMPESGGDIGDKFFKNAFAPVLMGVPLTIGYIILEAFKGGFDPKTQGAASLTAIRVDNVAISDLQSMIIAFAAVAVVYVGVFAAARGTFAEVATDFIKQKVKGLGTKAMQGLQMIPIIPAGQGGKGLSFYQAQGIGNKPWEDLMKKYGPNSVGGGNISVEEIQKIGKNRNAGVEEMKRVIGSADLSNPKAQQALAQSLEAWKAPSSPALQKKFAEEAIRKIGEPDFAALKKGAAGATALGKVKGLGTAPETSPVATRTPSGGAGAGTVATGATTGAAAGAGQSVADINSMEEIGLATDSLKTKREELRQTDLIVDPAKRKEARDKVEKEISAMPEFQTGKKVLVAKPSLDQVKTSVGNTAATAKGPEVKQLTGDLKKASDALKGKVSDDESKKILGGILKGKFGDGTQGFVAANPEIAQYVTVQ